MSKYIRQWNAKKVLAAVSGELVDRMDQAGQYVAEVMRSNAPVDRGILKSDIAYEVEARGNTVETRAGVKRRAFWAWFVERGTVKMAARPFIHRAVFGNAAEILRIIRGGR